jgi:transposase
MDNLPPHKHDPTLQLIGQAGATIRFLPAYSPDLNPIEKMWSRAEQFLRSAEARTGEELQKAIAAALASVTARDTINWFASCGYSCI